MGGLRGAGRGEVGECWARGQVAAHTPSPAFPHLPPNSARTGYATKGAYAVSPRICPCTDAVAAPSERFGHGPVYRSMDLGTNKTMEATVQAR